MIVARMLLVAGILVAMSMDVDAQRYRRRAYVAPHIGVGVGMGVGVGVSPYGVSVRSPYYSYSASPGVVVTSPRASYTSPYGYRYSWPGVSVSVAKPAFVPAEGAVVTSPGPTPATAYEEAPAYVPGPSLAPALAEPSNAAPELTQLLSAFHARLDQFTGGDGWKQYLAIPADSLADPVMRANLLERMESVARDPQFSAVSQLGEFQALHSALQAMSAAPPAEPTRPSLPPAPGGQGASGNYEAIPAPALHASGQPSDADGERSVLQSN